MNVQILLDKNGVMTDITSSVVSYELTKDICTGVGEAQIVVNGNSGYVFEISNYITIIEEAVTIGSYLIGTITKSGNDLQKVLECQDASKKMFDYFIDKVYTMTEGVTARYWIDKFLTEAGIAHAFTTTASGATLNSDSSLGPDSVYNLVISLVQQSGWYFTFNSNNTCVIGELSVNLSNYKYTFSDPVIENIEITESDKMLRNRAVVWGMASREDNSWVYSDMSVHTPWNYDALDKRAIVVANSNIRNKSAANSLASKMLQTFAQIEIEKTLTLIGCYNVSPGDPIYVDSKYYSGYALVTSVTKTLSSTGLKTILELDRRCPRIFGYVSYLDYVYVGTVGLGVWRKPLDEDYWEDFSEGLDSNNQNIVDLIVKDGFLVCVTSSKLAFYRKAIDTEWHPITFESVKTSDGSVIPGDYLRVIACSFDEKGDIIFGCNYLTVGYPCFLVKMNRALKQTWSVQVISPADPGYDKEECKDVYITDVESDGKNVFAAIWNRKGYKNWTRVVDETKDYGNRTHQSLISNMYNSPDIFGWNPDPGSYSYGPPSSVTKLEFYETFSDYDASLDAGPIFVDDHIYYSTSRYIIDYDTLTNKTEMYQFPSVMNYINFIRLRENNIIELSGINFGVDSATVVRYLYSTTTRSFVGSDSLVVEPYTTIVGSGIYNSKLEQTIFQDGYIAFGYLNEPQDGTKDFYVCKINLDDLVVTNVKIHTHGWDPNTGGLNPCRGDKHAINAIHSVGNKVCCVVCETVENFTTETFMVEAHIATVDTSGITVAHNIHLFDSVEPTPSIALYDYDCAEPKMYSESTAINASLNNGIMSVSISLTEYLLDANGDTVDYWTRIYKCNFYIPSGDIAYYITMTNRDSGYSTFTFSGGYGLVTSGNNSYLRLQIGASSFTAVDPETETLVWSTPFTSSSTYPVSFCYLCDTEDGCIYFKETDSLGAVVSLIGVNPSNGSRVKTIELANAYARSMGILVTQNYVMVNMSRYLNELSFRIYFGDAVEGWAGAYNVVYCGNNDVFSDVRDARDSYLPFRLEQSKPNAFEVVYTKYNPMDQLRRYRLLYNWGDEDILDLLTSYASKPIDARTIEMPNAEGKLMKYVLYGEGVYLNQCEQESRVTTKYPAFEQQIMAIETSNRNLTPWIFVATYGTIEDGAPRFFQKSPYGSTFVENSTGFPPLKISIIRIDDRV